MLWVPAGSVAIETTALPDASTLIAPDLIGSAELQHRLPQNSVQYAARPTYTGFTMDPSGVIQAQFSNGNTETIGQAAVATVANEQGLVATGGNNFQTTAATAASGQAVAGVAGTGGR